MTEEAGAARPGGEPAAAEGGGVAAEDGGAQAGVGQAGGESAEGGGVAAEGDRAGGAQEAVGRASGEPETAERVAAAVERLYGAPPGDFVRIRSELVKQARTAGDRQVATTIGALRKPTRAAAALNLLARSHPEAVDQWLQLGAQLRAAQRAADASALRDLTVQRRTLVHELLTAAAEVAGPLTPAVRDEMTTTLGAALTDEGVGSGLAAGTLVTAESWEGFGLPPGSHLRAVAGDAPASGSPAAARAPDGPAGRNVEKNSATSEQSSRELHAEAEHERAEAERRDQQQKVRELELELAEARRRVMKARETHRVASKRLTGLDDEITGLRDRLSALLDRREHQQEVVDATTVALDTAETGLRSAEAARARADGSG